jgi:hypothetical protein
VKVRLVGGRVLEIDGEIAGLYLKGLTPEQIATWINNVIEVIACIPDRVLRYEYTRTVADLFEKRSAR